jgi:hypothetical protein
MPNKTKWLYANPLPDDEKYENFSKRYELFIDELKANLSQILEEPVDDNNYDDLQEVYDFLEEDNRLLIGKRDWITESFSTKKENKKDELYFIIIGTKKEKDLQYIYGETVGELISLIRHYDIMIELYNNIVDTQSCPDTQIMIDNAYEYAKAVETGKYDKMVANAKYMKAFFADGFERLNMGQYLNYQSLEDYLDKKNINNIISKDEDIEEIINNDSINEYVKKILIHYRLNCSVNVNIEGIEQTKENKIQQKQKQKQQKQKYSKSTGVNINTDISETPLGQRMIELGVDPNNDFADFDLYIAEGKELQKNKNQNNQDNQDNQEE